MYDRDASVLFFNDTATTEIYTLSLHDALPICVLLDAAALLGVGPAQATRLWPRRDPDGAAGVGRARDHAPDALVHAQDRKSTRLNSSHANISYAVFCLKKKKHTTNTKSLAPCL